jgi:molecular chaperone HtpG
MREMSVTWGADFPMFENEETLVLNTASPVIKRLLEIKESKPEDVKLVCRQVYDLAMLSHKPLPVDDMSRFIERTNEILLRIFE